jgi:hypothetical protein
MRTRCYSPLPKEKSLVPGWISSLEQGKSPQATTVTQIPCIASLANEGPSLEVESGAIGMNGFSNAIGIALFLISDE